MPLGCRLHYFLKRRPALSEANATKDLLLYYWIVFNTILTEEALLKKIIADPDSFAEVFKLYYKPIFGYILRRTADFDSTADLAADTFLKAFLHIRKIKL